MTTLLSAKNRRAAHGKHRCGLCGRYIAQGEVYEDQRCADGGTAWTFRSHLACISAWMSWGPWEDDFIALADLSCGHLPPCPQAWADRESESCTCAPSTPEDPT